MGVWVAAGAHRVVAGCMGVCDGGAQYGCGKRRWGCVNVASFHVYMASVCVNGWGGAVCLWGRGLGLEWGSGIAHTA